MKRLCLILVAAVAAAQSPAHQPAGTIVVDASEFYHEIPSGDGIGSINAEWLFNNSVLTLGSKEDAVAKIAVPESGAYRLFVRSQGAAGSDALAAIQQFEAHFSFHRHAESFEPQPNVQLRRIPAQTSLQHRGGQRRQPVLGDRECA